MVLPGPENTRFLRLFSGVWSEGAIHAQIL